MGTDDLRISDMGFDGDSAFFALAPSVSHNTRGEYLVAWQGRDNFCGTGISIFTQRVSATGVELLPNDRRVSAIGPDGGQVSAQLNPALAFNPVSNEYLVAWSGRGVAGLAAAETEIVAQRLSPTSVELGTNDQRISVQGRDGDLAFSASRPAVAFEAGSKRYLIGWEGDDDTGELGDGETEIFVRTLTLP